VERASTAFDAGDVLARDQSDRVAAGFSGERAVQALGEAGAEHVFTAAIARDGRIAISRGTSSSDVVLIRAK
jgi:hypothetical protein